MRFSQLKRREFITLIAGVSMSPLAARAQQLHKMVRVGAVGLSNSRIYPC
jgi:hypothetical protein